MKQITLFLIMLFTSLGLLQAQDLPLDFESGTYNITNFDGGSLTVIDNPQSSGINTSSKVAKMVKNAGETWAGSYITLDNAIDFSSKKIFKVKVFSPKAGINVLLKVENASNGDINFEKESAITVANEWEELTFNFSAIDASKSYRNIVIIFERETAGDGSSNFTYLFDDITLVQDSGPSIAAPTPIGYDASKVISIFSEAFTSIDGTNFNPYWGQSTAGSIVNIQGTEVLKLADLNYHGIELLNDVNAASMKYLHVDVWTADETSLDIYPISRTTGERKANLSPLPLNQWNSFDIKISDIITSGFNLADLYQFKFIGAGGNTVYIDNLFLYDDNTETDTEAPEAFTATVSTITYNSIKLLLNATDNSGAINYDITVGGTTVTIGGASGVQKSYEFTQLPSSTEFTFSVSVKDLSGNEATNSPIQLVASTKQALLAPTESSPTPLSRNETDVISIFSDSYTNVANTNFHPWWQQSTWFFSVQVGGNEVLKYENFNYQGIEFGSQVDVSKMVYLHIDVWTPNETLLKISPISASTGEKEYNLTPLNLNEWNSYDIPLTSYSILGLSLTDIGQLKLVGSGKSVIYIDNIYFYKGEGFININENNIEAKVSYYPNPVSDKLNIECNSEISSISIYEITGQCIKSISVKSLSSTVDLNEINQGSYIVSITMKNGQKSIQKIIKH